MTGLYYYGARYYDPRISLWLTVDPLQEKYPNISTYAYCIQNPVKFIDPDGMELSTDVIKNKNGTYTVVGGKLDGDKNIYVVNNAKERKRTGEIIGQTATETSFYYSEDNVWLGTINPNDGRGQEFLENFKKRDLTIDYYKDHAKGEQYYDFKVTNGSDKVLYKTPEKHYRGMPIGKRVDTGVVIYSSARDIGNIAAGYIAGRYGLSWEAARKEFDKLESAQRSSNSVEGASTQNAQRFGFIRGKQEFLRESPGTTLERYVKTAPAGVVYFWEKLTK